MGVESTRSLNELTVHECLCKEVVSALIIQEGKILLMRRAAHESFAGAYELPGGTVEEGETHQETLAREILEETGLPVISIGALLGVSEFSSTSNTVARNFVYLVELEHGGVTLSDEHDEYCLVNPKEALQLPLSENARKALSMLSTKH